MTSTTASQTPAPLARSASSLAVAAAIPLAAPLLLGLLSLSTLACSGDAATPGPGLGGSEMPGPEMPDPEMPDPEMPDPDAAAPPVAMRGVCGQRGQAPVSATSFEGYEEYYLIADRGFGDIICNVRFNVARLGEAPGGCADCVWTHLVGFDTPTVVTDVDGVCAESQLGLDAARIAEIVASTAAYGFVNEYSGHNSVLMKYEESTQTWSPHGNATWDMMTNAFRFDRRDGVCVY